MAIRCLLEEGKPIHEITQEKDQQGSTDDLPKNSALLHGFELFHGKRHRIAYGEQKGGKYQVGRREPKPFGMLERGISKRLATRRIDNDHKADGHSPEYVQGKRPLCSGSHVAGKIVKNKIFCLFRRFIWCNLRRTAPPKHLSNELKTKTLNKVIQSLTLFAVLLIFVFPIQAQRLVRPQAGFVRLRNGLVKAQRNIADGSLKRDSLGAAHLNHHYYVMVQFDLLPDSVHRVQMIGSGLHLFDYIADRTYLAEVDDDFSIDSLKQYAVSGVFRLPAGSKIASRLQLHAQEDLRDADQLIAINYFGTVPADQVRQGITAAGASIQTVKFQPPHIYFARVADTMTLRRLAALPYVSYIASQPIKPRVLNYNNRAAQGADALGATSGRRLFGDGVVVGVGDDANPSSHIDFTGRLIVRTPAPYSLHGTHTSGTVGGGGILNPMYQGMAPHSTIISQYFSDILANAPTYVSDYDMVLTNNSYTDYPYGCAYDGEYDALAYATDAQLYQYPYLLHMFASGNDGSYTCSPFPPQFSTIKSGFQAAKNVLTVGQIDNSNYYGTNTYYSGSGSSAGPTFDGRLKPEIVAGGEFVISTTPNNGYQKDWGTSMASPTITGGMALLVQ